MMRQTCVHGVTLLAVLGSRSRLLFGQSEVAVLDRVLRSSTTPAVGRCGMPCRMGLTVERHWRRARSALAVDSTAAWWPRPRTASTSSTTRRMAATGTDLRVFAQHQNSSESRSSVERRARASLPPVTVSAPPAAASPADTLIARSRPPVAGATSLVDLQVKVREYGLVQFL